MNPTTFPIEPGAMADLRARLAERADELTLLDIAYRTIDSPVGPLLLAATETGLVRVAFEREGFDGVLESLATHAEKANARNADFSAAFRAFRLV